MSINKKEQLVSDKTKFIFLGFAFLVVFVLSVIYPVLTSPITGTPLNSIPIEDVLVNISNNVPLIRLGIFIQMITSLSIIFLAVMLNTVFKYQNKLLAQLALGWWLAEAITIVFEIIGIFAMISLSLEFVEAGTPGDSYYLTFAHFFYSGLYDYAFIIHNTFFALGAIVWYYLFYKSKIGPKPLAVWGLVSICLLSISVLFAVYDPEMSIFLLNIPYIPFEPVIGTWFVYKGIKSV